MISDDIARKITQILNENTIGYFRFEGCDLTFETKIMGFKGSVIRIRNPIPYTLISSAVEAGSYGLKAGNLDITVHKILPSGLDMDLHIHRVEEDSAMKRTDDRRQSQQHARFFFVNPVDHITFLTKPVMEMTDSGLSFLSKTNSSLYLRGVELEGKISQREDVIFTGKIRIAYSRKLRRLDGQTLYQIGASKILI